MKRERASQVAELFAEWLNKPADLNKLNKLSFEAFLWLPPNIAHHLGRRLSNKSDAKDIKAILIDIRHLIQNQKDDLLSGEIIHWPVNNPPKQKLIYFI